MLVLRQRTSGCPQCGTTAQRGAIWCGWCGAAMTRGRHGTAVDAPRGTRAHHAFQHGGHRGHGGHGHDEAAEDHGGDAGQPLPRRRFGRGIVLVAVLGVLAVGAVLSRPPPVATSLVGRLDVGAGPSATHPPPPGLALAWRQRVRPAPGGDEGWFAGTTGQAVVGGQRAVLGGVVVERSTGEVVADLRAAPLHGTWGADGKAATLHGGMLEVVEVMTGDVVVRTPADPALADPEAPRADPLAIARGERTSLFAAWGPRGDDDRHGWGSWVLVADDGSVVASGPGSPNVWGPTRSRSSTHAVVSVPPEDPTEDGGGAPEQWSVISLATGAEVLRVSPQGEWWVPPQVVGTHALVVHGPVREDGGVASGGSGGSLSDGQELWEVELHDLAAGRLRWRTQLVAEDVPTLQAVTDAGRGVVVSHERSTMRVVVVGEDGATEVAALPTPAGGLWADGPMSAGWAAADGEVVVMLDTATDALVATELDGTRRWRTALPPLPDEARVELEVAGDLAVLTIDGGDRPRLHVVDLADGRRHLQQVLLGVPRHFGLSEPGIAATLDGLVAVTTAGDVPWEPAPTLGAVDWFDVRDGRERALEQVAAGWLRGVEVPDALAHADGSLDTSGFLRARLSGTTLADDGRVRPVVVWPERDDTLDVLAGRGAPTTVDLPPAPAADLPPGQTGPGGVEDHEVVAVVGRTVVLRQGDTDGRPRTIVLDRDAGGATMLADTRPLAVAGRVVLGQRDPGNGAATLVAHGLDDGALRWEAPWAWGDVLAADERQAVLATGSRVTAREPAEGTVLWRTDLDRLLTGPVVLTERAVLLHTPYGEVVALDRDGGQVAWRSHVGGVVTSLGAAGDHALVGTRDGTVVQLGADGEEVQRVTVGSVPVTAVASAGPTVVAMVGREVVGLRPDGAGIARQDEVPLP